MKKRDKAIKDITSGDEIEGIISRSDVCYVDMVDRDRPYVLVRNRHQVDEY
jgi:nitroimidazol reductase NimA-like FMN-containing flavoprotein (pyridoxamine 5'-phosphate oxidase superfamily)